jgi:hypothetical protein
LATSAIGRYRAAPGQPSALNNSAVGPVLGIVPRHVLALDQEVHRTRAAQPAVDGLGEPRRAHQQGQEALARRSPDLGASVATAALSSHRGGIARGSPGT